MPLWALVWVKNARRCLHWRPTEADIVVPPSERIQKQELEEGDPIMTSSFRAIPSWTNGTSMKMATTGQKWETVGKSNKKSKPNGSTGNKQQRKSLRDNMPKLDVAGKFPGAIFKCNTLQPPLEISSNEVQLLT